MRIDAADREAAIDNLEAIAQAHKSGCLSIVPAIERSSGRVAWLICISLETTQGDVAVPIGEVFDRATRRDDFSITSLFSQAGSVQ